MLLPVYGKEVWWCDTFTQLASESCSTRISLTYVRRWTYVGGRKRKNNHF